MFFVIFDTWAGFYWEAVLCFLLACINLLFYVFPAELPNDTQTNPARLWLALGVAFTFVITFIVIWFLHRMTTPNL
jgi:hypothetical protein